MIQEILRKFFKPDSVNVSPNNRLVDASFLSERDIEQAKAEIANWRVKLDKETGANKIKHGNV